MDTAELPTPVTISSGGIEQSTTISKLTGALAKFHATCPVIVRDKMNAFFKASYADLGTILGVVNPLLSAQGLVVSQFPLPDNNLCTQVTHESGEFMRSTFPLKPAKSDPQGIGSAMTYQRRYALCAILNLAIDDEDDDGQAASKGDKTAAPRTNADKLRNELRSMIGVVGKDAAEVALAEAGPKFKNSKGQPIAGLKDIATIDDEKTLRDLFTLFSSLQKAPA